MLFLMVGYSHEDVDQEPNYIHIWLCLSRVFSAWVQKLPPPPIEQYKSSCYEAWQARSNSGT